MVLLLAVKMFFISMLNRWCYTIGSKWQGYVLLVSRGVDCKL